MQALESLTNRCFDFALKYLNKAYYIAKENAA